MCIPTTYRVACHTDHVGHGSTFVAIQGLASDGVSFIPQALERGATKILVDTNAVIPDCGDVLVERVANTRRALATESARAYGYPAKKLKILGITGTKGKTSVAWLTYHLLRAAGKRVALLSTVCNKINDTLVPTQLTTQQPDYIHVFLHECVAVDVEFVVMEVAAQAFTFDRVYGLEFEHALFTNFNPEHAELYPDQSNYFAAKAQIAQYVKPHGTLFYNRTSACVAEFCAQQNFVASYECTERLSGINLSGSGSEFTYEVAGFSCRFSQQLLGLCNVHNACNAISLVSACGVSVECIERGLTSFAGIPGRMEKVVLPNGAVAYIDFAHTVCSYKAVFEAVRPLTDHLIVVFGCGGDRDRTKRAPMAACVAQYADIAIVTSDNPRNEDPESILDQVLVGLADFGGTVIRQSDRKKALCDAYACSHKNSIIAVLGKGPDEYQIVKGRRLPFNDKKILSSCAFVFDKNSNFCTIKR